jgi:hypothetical protein
MTERGSGTSRTTPTQRQVVHFSTGAGGPVFSRRPQAFWIEGRAVTEREVVDGDEEGLGRLNDCAGQWTVRARDWISAHISVVEAERFRRPEAGRTNSRDTSFDGRRRLVKDQLHEQLDELIRLRDEQRASLR